LPFEEYGIDEPILSEKDRNLESFKEKVSWRGVEHFWKKTYSFF